MPRKKKPKTVTIEEMREHILTFVKGASDISVSRIYETVTGITAAQKMSDGSIRLIT
mgnify:CR=1 FL=1|tara:strand:+ start:717 stop:887 length:171 start_codon:yes stop_codon:yes gene_type:complete